MLKVGENSKSSILESLLSILDFEVNYFSILELFFCSYAVFI